MTDVAFSMRSELMLLFMTEQADQQESDFLGGDKKGDAFGFSLANEDISYLPWRSAAFVFNAIKPFFDSEAYSVSILKGLITSSGGLTESTLKAS
jgi:hypothetical protein